MQDLLWFRLDFGRGCASTPATDDTLYSFSVVTVVAYFVWRSTLVERFEGFVAGQTRRICLEVLIERVDQIWFFPRFIAGCLSVTGSRG